MCLRTCCLVLNRAFYCFLAVVVLSSAWVLALQAEQKWAVDNQPVQFQARDLVTLTPEEFRVECMKRIGFGAGVGLFLACALVVVVAGPRKVAA